jgi:hypothetical protein
LPNQPKTLEDIKKTYEHTNFPACSLGKDELELEPMVTMVPCIKGLDLSRSRTLRPLAFPINRPLISLP